jgi:hypothetical protein
MNTAKIKKLALLPSIIAYLASLVMPALIYPTGEIWSGAAVLFLGWLSVFAFFEIRWFANVFFIISILGHSSKSTLPKVAAVLAAILAICCILLPVYVATGDEGGSIGHSKATLGTGAYVWVLALFLNILAVFYPFKKSCQIESAH